MAANNDALAVADDVVAVTEDVADVADDVLDVADNTDALPEDVKSTDKDENVDATIEDTEEPRKRTRCPGRIRKVCDAAKEKALALEALVAELEERENTKTPDPEISWIRPACPEVFKAPPCKSYAWVNPFRKPKSENTEKVDADFASLDDKPEVVGDDENNDVNVDKPETTKAEDGSDKPESVMSAEEDKTDKPEDVLAADDDQMDKPEDVMAAADNTDALPEAVMSVKDDDSQKPEDVVAEDVDAKPEVVMSTEDGEADKTEEVANEDNMETPETVNAMAMEDETEMKDFMAEQDVVQIKFTEDDRESLDNESMPQYLDDDSDEAVQVLDIVEEGADKEIEQVTINMKEAEEATYSNDTIIGSDDVKEFMDGVANEVEEFIGGVMGDVHKFKDSLRADVEDFIKTIERNRTQKLQLQAQAMSFDSIEERITAKLRSELMSEIKHIPTKPSFPDDK